MNEVEQQIADEVYAAIQAYSNTSDRSLQSKNYQVGISDLGFCSERTRRMLVGEHPGDTDSLAAFIGTAVGDHLEKAVSLVWPDVVTQIDATLKLEGMVQGEPRTFEVPGHPDLARPSGLLLDGKTKDGLALAERSGATQQQRYQRHGYAKALADAGFFTVPITEVLVGNIWIDRSGGDKRVHVEVEPFDPDVIREMTHWLEEVVEAYLAKETATKEPARELCQVACGFFDECRMFDTDASGLLTDPEVVEAARMYHEGRTLASEGTRLKNQAKSALDGMNGSTGEFIVRWVEMNEVEVGAFTRRAHKKLDLKQVKR